MHNSRSVIFSVDTDYSERERWDGLTYREQLERTSIVEYRFREQRTDDTRTRHCTRSVSCVHCAKETTVYSIQETYRLSSIYSMVCACLNLFECSLTERLEYVILNKLLHA